MNNYESMFPTKNDILEAYKRITPFINKTPLLHNKYINDMAKANVSFKC